MPIVPPIDTTDAVVINAPGAYTRFCTEVCAAPIIDAGTGQQAIDSETKQPAVRKYRCNTTVTGVVDADRGWDSDTCPNADNHL
jgi:hypothetical protein